MIVVCIAAGDAPLIFKKVSASINYILTLHTCVWWSLLLLSSPRPLSQCIVLHYYCTFLKHPAPSSSQLTVELSFKNKVFEVSFKNNVLRSHWEMFANYLNEGENGNIDPDNNYPPGPRSWLIYDSSGSNREKWAELSTCWGLRSGDQESAITCVIPNLECLYIWV